MSLVPIALAFTSGAMGDIGALKTKLRAWAKDDPMDAILATILGGGVAFYLAEKDAHPELASPWDGVLHMATTLWHGSSLQPATAAGRALVAFVQAFGPTLVLAAFDEPAAEKHAAEKQAAQVQLAILERLDRIVQLLERQP